MQPCYGLMTPHSQHPLHVIFPTWLVFPSFDTYNMLIVTTCCTFSDALSVSLIASQFTSSIHYLMSYTNCLPLCIASPPSLCPLPAHHYYIMCWLLGFSCLFCISDLIYFTNTNSTIYPSLGIIHHTIPKPLATAASCCASPYAPPMLYSIYSS
jgi:hypothetical protein